jgi:hypothetical protein
VASRDNLKVVLAEYRRPWKIATFLIGLGLLIVGSFVLPAPDWDIPISIVMASFTYLTAGWSMHVMVERRWRDWPLMIILTWWCVDGCYALYWSFVDSQALDFMRDVNWPASLSLYWMCGLVWYWNGPISDLLKLLRQKIDHAHR